MKKIAFMIVLVCLVASLVSCDLLAMITNPGGEDMGSNEVNTPADDTNDNDSTDNQETPVDPDKPDNVEPIIPPNADNINSHHINVSGLK